MSLLPLDKTFKVDKKLGGIHLAIVVANSLDPDKRGGIHVKIPGIFESDDSKIQYLPLVYPQGSIGGTQDNSSINIPQVGSNVFVEFMDQEDPYSGIYISSLLTKKSFPEILKEDYPHTSGKTWSGEEKLPSWLKINKKQEYIELFLNPSKTILKIDKEGRVFISSPDDISFFSSKSLNFDAENINFKSSTLTQKCEKIGIDSNSYNLTTQTFQVKSTSTKLDLGAILKKSLSEIYETSSISYKAPVLFVEGFINSSGVNTTLINSTPLPGLYTGSVSYAGGTYVPSPIPPIVIPPIDNSEISSALATIGFIKDLIDSHLTEYSSTSEYMKRQSDELRNTFKNEAKKWIGSKDYTLKEAETDLSDPLLLAEEYVILKNSESQLNDLNSKMSVAQVDGQTSLSSMESEFSGLVSSSHSQMSSDFTQNENYSELFSDLDKDVQVEALDKFNETAPQPLQLPLPLGFSTFSSLPESILQAYIDSMSSASIFLVVNGVFFNSSVYFSLSDWAQVNSLTTITNFKQKHIIPNQSESQKDSFSNFITTVRKIEIISCKIQELMHLLARLASAISGILSNLSSLSSLLANIWIILPVWIRDLISNLINQIRCGDLPRICSVGSVSPEELQSLPDDLKSLLGPQNRVVTKMYSYEKQYSSLISNIAPSTTLLESALTFSKSSLPSSGINIIR